MPKAAFGAAEQASSSSAPRAAPVGPPRLLPALDTPPQEAPSLAQPRIAPAHASPAHASPVIAAALGHDIGLPELPSDDDDDVMKDD